MSIVKVSGLKKQYPAFELKNVSFEITEGRITGFVGRNGAGKTTTIKAMLNLIHLDGGSVYFFDKDFYLNEEEIKKRIGYSTGTVNWYPRKKIKDIAGVVKRFYDTWDEEVYRKYLSLFGIDETKTPRELSDGMKVKLNLLLALSHRCEVLILDEPTSGLDPFSRSELLDVLLELKKDGVAIFFSTHIISDLEKCADDIIYISGGEIIEAMTTDSFIKKHGMQEESLEDIILRMEGGIAHGQHNV